MSNVTKKKGIGRKGDLIFHWALLIWPLLQFAVFYIAVNFNSFKMAFERVEGQSFFYYFENIFDAKYMWHDVLGAVKTSVIFYVISMVISVPLALLFAYYISKKLWGGKVFRLFLFLPSIVSSMVMVVLFHQFVDKALGTIWQDVFNSSDKPLLISPSNPDSYVSVMLFYIWTNFGTTTLIYSNKMAEISPETLEAAQLDGATSWQEFFYIVLPFTYPTLSVFLVTGFATIFTNQYNLFSFFGSGLGFDTGTMGYYIFNAVQDAAGKGSYDANVFNQYAALSIVVTAVLVPMTLGLRWALDKFGPQE